MAGRKRQKVGASRCAACRHIEALRAVPNDADRLDVDRWWALGDLVLFCPRPVASMRHHQAIAAVFEEKPGRRAAGTGQPRPIEGFLRRRQCPFGEAFRLRRREPELRRRSSRR